MVIPLRLGCYISYFDKQGYGILAGEVVIVVSGAAGSDEHPVGAVFALVYVLYISVRNAPVCYGQRLAIERYLCAEGTAGFVEPSAVAVDFNRGGRYSRHQRRIRQQAAPHPQTKHNT